MVKNVTDNQHKTIFFSVVDTLDICMKCIKQRIIYIMYILVLKEIKSVEVTMSFLVVT